MIFRPGDIVVVRSTSLAFNVAPMPPREVLGEVRRIQHGWVDVMLLKNDFHYTYTTSVNLLRHATPTEKLAFMLDESLGKGGER